MPEFIGKFKELMENPISRGMILEAAYSFILMVWVAVKVFGYKPKLSPLRVLLAGSSLVLSNLALLFITQERDPELYGRTVFYLAVPVIWLALYARHNDRSLAGLLAVITAAWMLFFLEGGLVLKNYVNALSMAIVLIPSFQRWRDPEQEGFIRTSIKKWEWAVDSYFFFALITVTMVVFGWDDLMITRYCKQHQFMLLISAILFFFMKAVPEELVFRGIFQGALKDKFGFLPALIGASLLYGAAALNDPANWVFPNWRAAVNAVLLGLGCGIVYHKTRSLAVSGVVNASVSFVWWFIFAHGGY